MPYTESELETIVETLETALARGEQTVQFSDRSVTYRTVADLRSALAYFQSLLDQLNGGRSKQSRGYASKGF